MIWAIETMGTMFLCGVLLASCGKAMGSHERPVAGANPRAPKEPRPTEPFRHEHVEIKEHLQHLHGMIGRLSGESADQQRETMKFIVDFLAKHIEPHAAWEERVLYPAVDRRRATGAEPFTASMRYEHGVVKRWISELQTQALDAQPDARVFARRADNLLGLIWAHFEEEEEVLLPILDSAMTREQFEDEIGRHAQAH